MQAFFISMQLGWGNLKKPVLEEVQGPPFCILMAVQESLGPSYPGRQSEQHVIPWNSLCYWMHLIAIVNTDEFPLIFDLM